jgi:hypothetical protein
VRVGKSSSATSSASSGSVDHFRFKSTMPFGNGELLSEFIETFKRRQKEEAKKATEEVRRKQADCKLLAVAKGEGVGCYKALKNFTAEFANPSLDPLEFFGPMRNKYSKQLQKYVTRCVHKWVSADNGGKSQPLWKMKSADYIRLVLRKIERSVVAATSSNGSSSEIELGEIYSTVQRLRSVRSLDELLISIHLHSKYLVHRDTRLLKELRPSASASTSDTARSGATDDHRFTMDLRNGHAIFYLTYLLVGDFGDEDYGRLDALDVSNVKDVIIELVKQDRISEREHAFKLMERLSIHSYGSQTAIEVSRKLIELTGADGLSSRYIYLTDEAREKYLCRREETRQLLIDAVLEATDLADLFIGRDLASLTVDYSWDMCTMTPSML